MLTKFNEYAWFGVGVPTSAGLKEPFLDIEFDINNSGNEDPGTPNVYNLVLDSGPNGLFETDHVEDSTGQKFYYAGTPFLKAFPGGRGTIYDWAYTTKPYPQFNVEISTKVLTQYSSKINFSSVYIDSHGTINWADGLYWAKLNFEQEVIPEFGLKEAVAATALGAGLVAAKVVKSKKEWSRREFLRFPKTATESLL